MSTTLSGKQKHYLRGLAHARDPVVIVGSAGPTTAVKSELDSALTRHELVKIRLPAVDRHQRAAIVEDLCRSTAAQPVQLIGRIGIVYRAKQDPEIQLP